MNDIQPHGTGYAKIPVSHHPHHDDNESSDSSEFKTPEEVATEQPEVPDTSHTAIIDGVPHQPKQKKHRFKEWWSGLNKKKRILVIAIILVVLLGGVGGIWALTNKKATPAPVAKQQTITPPAPAPTIVPSTLTGLPVAPSVNQRPVTGVMIENSLDARPQSGLNQAGVVFEAIAEGGITRFLALFQDTQPDYIGPVRSARPYYLQWALGFDASLAHVGGSPEALNDIKSWNVKDLDQFANSGFYQRISSRYAPHNVYTSIAQLNQLETNKGYTTAQYTGFVRKSEAPSTGPTARSIDFNISGFYYNVHYDYIAASNSYKRSEAGQPHVDLKSGQQITPKVVVAMIIPQGIEPDDLHSSYNTIGSGQAYVFQDGIVKIGTWHKSSSTSQITFLDSNNVALGLNPGQTWVSVVGASSGVTYKP